jgi:carbamoyl-phosphate synthase large subunit
MGVLEKFGVEMIGATAEAIDKAEDRELFREAMDQDRAGDAALAPSPIRGLGGARRTRRYRPAGHHPPLLHAGRHRRRHRLQPRRILDIVERGLDASPTTEVLIEESVLGWKEYEMEVVRDKADNCIIICSIENIDPMGVHTGDSITVAPALTLTDKEYQIMRNASIAVLREIGVETGGSNVQFAVNPEDGRWSSSR